VKHSSRIYATPALRIHPREPGKEALEVIGVAKDHGPSVKNDKQYEGLRKKGMSKERAAKISNANTGSGNAASKKGGKKGGKKSS
jgi:hypothetical protein